MEKIINLQKERKERRISDCLSYKNQIKLNINLNNINFFEKAVKEISKKILYKEMMEKGNVEEGIKSIQKKVEHFTINVEFIDTNNEAENNLILLMGTVQLRYPCTKNKATDSIINERRITDYAKSLIPVKCTISDGEQQFGFYSLLKERFNDKALKYFYRVGSSFVKIVDFYTEIAQIYLVNELVNYYQGNKDVCNETVQRFDNAKRYYKGFLNYVNSIMREEEKAFLRLENTYYFSTFNTKYGTAIITSYAKEVLGAILKEMVFDNEDIVLQEKQLNQIKTDYAKSYEEKKNINKETIEAMKYSKFNNYFERVEFDNDTDLIKIKQLENEFIDTINYLNPEDTVRKFMSSVTLRYRYLGHHRAAGLYFPSYKTICIDLRDPSAFLHEFMHMIDYHGYSNYKLSSRYDFRKIIKKYIDALDNTVENLPDDNPFKIEYRGHNKYNRGYYCNSAEIFARCGEIYLARILKIDNSLIRTLTDYVYPNDDELTEMIKNYYQDIFTVEDEYKVSASVSQTATQIAITTASTDKYEIKTKVLDNGQIEFLI